jgi:uncharacterized protein
MKPDKLPAPDALLAWWRVPMVWLVIGGPAAVVLASFVTAVIAVRGGDTPLLEGAKAHPGTTALSPATQARNHAASPRP